MAGPIEYRTHLDASPDTVHDLLTDIAAWPAWSPHVASSDRSWPALSTLGTRRRIARLGRVARVVDERAAIGRPR